MKNIELPPPTNIIAAEDVGSRYFPIVVLRDDQLDLIRQIVREELRAALGQSDSPPNRWEPF